MTVSGYPGEFVQVCTTCGKRARLSTSLVSEGLALSSAAGWSHSRSADACPRCAKAPKPAAKARAKGRR